MTVVVAINDPAADKSAIVYCVNSSWFEEPFTVRGIWRTTKALVRSRFAK